MTVKFHGDATAVEALVKRLGAWYGTGSGEHLEIEIGRSLYLAIGEAKSCIEALQAEIADHKTDIKQLKDLADAHGDEWNLAEQRAEALALALRAAMVMTDRGSHPRKLDEALCWKANDDLARSMADEALAAHNKAKQP